MRISLVLLCLPLLIPLGCQSRDNDLILELSNTDRESLGVGLESVSRSYAVDKRFAYSNSAGVGNLSLIFVGGEGRSFPGCGGFVDPPLDYGEEAILEAGERRDSEHSLLLLKEVYCLRPGRYTVSAVYADRHGNHVVSNVVPIEIEGAAD